MNRRAIVAVTALALLASSLPFAANAEQVTIRLDWSVIPGQVAPLMPTVAKYAPEINWHYGKSYVVEPIRLQGGGAALTALAADQIDVGGVISPQLVVLAVSEAKLDVKVIGQVITTEMPGYLFTNFWVRKADIKSIQDLRGKVIAVSARGANVDSSAHIIMSRVGMQEPRDYQISEIRFTSMIAALESRKVDAVPLVPPFHKIAEKHPALAPLFSVGDAFGPVETLMFMAKTRFIQKNRAALVDFLEDVIRMRRWWADPKTRPAAIKQLSDTAKIPQSEYVEWVYSKGDYYYHPQALVNVERLQNNIKTLKEAGVIPGVIDVKPIVDMSLAQEAAARINN